MPDGYRPKRDRGPRVLTGGRLTQQVLERLQAVHLQFVRGVRNGRRMVLRRCDLRGLDLSGMDLTGAELLACDFSRANLRNTNLRLAESDALQGYLHRFRKVSGGQRDRFRAARKAYGRVWHFVRDSSVVSDYRRSPDRPSSLALEVRKDLLCQFDPETGLPLPMRPETEETVTSIARVIAAAISTYFKVDRKQPLTAPLQPDPA